MNRCMKFAGRNDSRIQMAICVKTCDDLFYIVGLSNGFSLHQNLFLCQLLVTTIVTLCN